jgi:hypothetical protein
MEVTPPRNDLRLHGVAERIEIRVLSYAYLRPGGQRPEQDDSSQHGIPPWVVPVATLES